MSRLHQYIALFKGINVSGQKLIKMDALRNAFSDMGMKDVVTYIQSGNVIFSADENSIPALTARIIQMVKSTFGFDVEIQVREATAFVDICDQNPFLKQVPAKDESFLHVTMLSAPPLRFEAALLDQRKSPEEEYVLCDDILYLYCPNGYGRSKLTNSFIESHCKVLATTRNARTMLQLKQLLA